MTTIVNTPASNESSGSGGLVALVVLILLAVLFLYFGLPILNRGFGNTVNIPENIDVNINTPNQ